METTATLLSSNKHIYWSIYLCIHISIQKHKRTRAHRHTHIHKSTYCHKERLFFASLPCWQNLGIQSSRWWRWRRCTSHTPPWCSTWRRPAAQWMDQTEKTWSCHPGNKGHKINGWIRSWVIQHERKSKRQSTNDYRACPGCWTPQDY